MAFVMNTGIFSITRSLSKIRCKPLIYRAISTSEKKKDGAAIEGAHSKDGTIPDFTKPLENKNWISYGFSRTDEKEDVNDAHNAFFFGITLCCVVGGVFFAYFPDYRERDWSQREAFLLIRYREANGLPHIDRNYVDPSQIVLPTDEELGDREIII